MLLKLLSSSLLLLFVDGYSSSNTLNIKYFNRVVSCYNSESKNFQNKLTLAQSKLDIEKESDASFFQLELPTIVGTSFIGLFIGAFSDIPLYNIIDPLAPPAIGLLLLPLLSIYLLKEKKNEEITISLTRLVGLPTLGLGKSIKSKIVNLVDFKKNQAVNSLNDFKSYLNAIPTKILNRISIFIEAIVLKVIIFFFLKNFSKNL
jgi:hypothetical protein